MIIWPVGNTRLNYSPTFSMLRAFYLPALLGYLLTTSPYSLAQPVVDLCINHACKNPSRIQISDAVWQLVRDLYNSPFSKDKDEQDNIASAISLMETDVYYTLATRIHPYHHPGNYTAPHPDPPPDTEELASIKAIKEWAADLFNANTEKNNYRNIKTYLAVLMDNHLVTRHFMRKTLNQKSWSGLTSHAIMLQSLKSSQLYVLQINNSDLGTPPVISPYTSGKDIFNNPGTELSEGDEDFE